MTFNTIEDINGTQFDHQGFWWYELDTALIDPTGEAEFSDVKVDFLTISKENYNNNNYWRYRITIDNELWTRGYQVLDKTGQPFPIIWQIEGEQFNIIFRKSSNASPVKICIYLGHLNISTSTMNFYLAENELYLNLKQLNVKQSFVIVRWDGRIKNTISRKLVLGFNEIISGTGSMALSVGYLLVKLLKTDFQFQCNQSLTIGEVNTVSLGTDTDYKLNGDLVGEYATKLSVQYGDKTLPVVWNESLNDYTFDLDLTDKTDEGKVRFKVIVEANEVLNSSETDVVLDCKFETIDSLAKLIELFRIGGVGRLGANLTLTDDLTVSKSVNLIGNDCSIDMSNCKVVVPSDLTFKAQSVGFSNGVNTLQQEPNSTVEITDCSFTNCTGFGSVIDCQVDLASLDETDDFNTKLTNCTITNCDMAILHGGNLEVTGCNVNGKISNKNYPYFLYQTDGNATILNSQFNLSSNTEYDYDLEFNTCIFTCGETATVNGYSHTELQQNNRSAFFDTQRNTSKINVKYYYSLIEDTVHLQSSKGFCHSVSNVDFVYKTNITLTRGD